MLIPVIILFELLVVKVFIHTRFGLALKHKRDVYVICLMVNLIHYPRDKYDAKHPKCLLVKLMLVNM